MLNRRFLRVKAMQAVYAYRQKQESNFNLALEQIDEDFQPDLNSMEPPNMPRLRANKRDAKQAFRQGYQKRKLKNSLTPEVLDSVTRAVDGYYNQLREDRKRIQQQMLADVEEITHSYFAILAFVIELKEYIGRLKVRHDKNPDMVMVESHYKLGDSVFLEALSNTEDITKEIAKRSISWKGDDSLVKRVYKNQFDSNERYAEFIATLESDFEADQKIMHYLIRKVLFKHEDFLSHFEENDPHWSENEDVVLSMLVKTFKGMVAGKPVELAPLSQNWKADKAFFTELFDEVIDNSDELDEIVKDKLKNWELDRVAMMDKIILEMAIAEMTHFSNIPIKVTINEFIELSKNYSTPKSKQFVNGVLDVVSKELTQSGKIKKSGRGLIDNQ